MFIVVKHLRSGIEGMGPLDLFCQSDILLYRNGKGLAVLLFPWGGASSIALQPVVFPLAMLWLVIVRLLILS